MFRHFWTSSSQNLFLMTHGWPELNRVAVIISVSAYLRCDVGKNVTATLFSSLQPCVIRNKFWEELVQECLNIRDKQQKLGKVI